MSKTEQTKAAEEFTADDLLAELRPEQSEFAVALKGGREVRFRVPADASEYYRLGIVAQKWAETCLSGRAHDMWKPYLPLPKPILVQCFWVHSLAVSPPFPQPTVLKMAAENGPLLGLLYNSLQERIGSIVAESEVEALDGLGEG